MPYSEETKADVIAALTAAPWSVAAVAQAYGIAHTTVTKWARAARLQLPSSHARILAASERGQRAQHGDWRARRLKAIALRKQGKSLTEIRSLVGYRSVASVYYALQANVTLLREKGVAV